MDKIGRRNDCVKDKRRTYCIFSHAPYIGHMDKSAMRSLRRQLGYTQAELASELEMSKRQIQNYEYGFEIPRVVELACKQLESENDLG